MLSFKLRLNMELDGNFDNKIIGDDFKQMRLCKMTLR